MYYLKYFIRCFGFILEFIKILIRKVVLNLVTIGPTYVFLVESVPFLILVVVGSGYYSFALSTVTKL